MGLTIMSHLLIQFNLLVLANKFSCNRLNLMLVVTCNTLQQFETSSIIKGNYKEMLK